MITCNIEQTLAELGSFGNSSKRLTLTSWNGNPAKLDLRTWREESGELKPGKGITLTEEEGKALMEALTAHFGALG